MAKQLNVNLAVNANTQQAKTALDELNRSLSKVIESRSITINDTSINKAKQAAMDLKRHLDAATDVNTGKLDLSKFSASLAKSGQSLQGLHANLSKIGPDGQSAFLALSKSIASADASALTLGNRLGGLLTTLKNTARWQISSSLLHGFMGAIQEAYGYAQDLNQSLNNIRIVTGLGTDEMAQFAKEANAAAKALSTRTTEYTDAALIYYQQGIRDQDEIAARTATTIKLANVSRQSAEEVSSQMTAIWNNFYDGSKSIEYYADVITKLGASTASSSDEIAEGLQKFAAIADTVGLSYEKATAALATVVAETRQSADVVGTAFKTMFARFQGLSLGETLEDGVDLNKYSKALKTVGVEILDANGELKEMDTILDETYARWNSITEAQRVALAETVAGTRQYAQFMAIMNNYDKIQANESLALGAEGSLQEQADIYAEGWEAARDRVKAALEEIYTQLLDDKAFITILNGLEKVIGFVSNMIDGLGGLKGLLMIIGSIVLNKYAKEMPAFFERMIQNIQILTGKAEENRQSMLSQNMDIINSMRGASSSKEVSAQVEGMSRVSEMTLKLAQNRRNLSQAEADAYEGKIKEVQMYSQVAEAIGKEVDALNKESSALEKSLSSDLRKEGFFGKIDLDNIDSTEAQQAVQDAQTQRIREQQELVDDLLNRWRALSAEEKKSDVGQGLLKNLQTAKKDLDTLQTKGVTGKDLLQGLKQTAIEAGKVDSILSTVDGKTAHWGQALKQAGNDSTAIKAITDEIEVYVSKAEEAGLDTTNIRDALKDFAAGKADIETVTNALKDLADTSRPADLESGIDSYKTALVNLGASSTVIDDFVQKLRNGASAEEAFKTALEQIGKSADASLTHVIGVSEAIGKLGGAAMQLSMAINAVKNIGRIWADEDLSTGEKILQTMMSLGTILPIITTLTNGQKIAELGAAAARILGIQTIGGMTAAEYAKAAADTTIAVTGWAALGPLLLFVAIAGAAVAAIMLIVKAFKDMHKHSPEGKLEEARKTAKALGEALDDAKTAADNLRAAIDKYKSAKETLDSCTKGTQEWRDALEEVNTAAKEVLNNVNGLSADEIKKLYSTENGYIEFDADKLDELQKKAEARIAAADYAVSQSKYEVAMAQAAVDAKTGIGATLSAAEYAYTATPEGYGYSQGSQAIGQKIMDNLDKLVGKSGKQLETSLRELGINIGELSDTTLANLEEQINALSDSTQAANAQLELMSRLKVDEILGNDYDQAAKNIAAAQLSKQTQAISDDVLGALTDGKFGSSSYKGKDNISKGQEQSDFLQGYLDRLNAANNTNWVQAKNAIQGDDNNRIFEFLDELGEVHTLTAQQVADQIAAAEALQQVGESARNAAAQLANMGDGMKSFIATGNLEGVAKAQYDEIRNGYDFATDEQGNVTKESAKAYLTDVEGLSDEVAEQFAQELANSLNLDWSDITSGIPDNMKDAMEELTIGQAKAMKESYSKLGELGDGSLKTAFDSIIESIPVEQLADVMGEFSAVDFTDWDSIEDFKTYLLDIAGVDPVAVEQFADDLQIANHAIRNIDTAGLAAKFKEIQDIIDSLKVGDTISAEDYGKLGPAAKKYFSIMADGTYQLVGNAEELKKAQAEDRRAELRNSAEATMQNISTQEQHLGNSQDIIGNNREIIGANQNYTDENGKNWYNSNIVSDQIDLIKEFSDEIGVSQEKIAEWEADLADNSSTVDVIAEIAQYANDAAIASDKVTESLAAQTQELLDIENMYLSTATSVEDLNSLYLELQGQLGDIPVAYETWANGLIRLAAQFDNCTDEIEAYQEALNGTDDEALAAAEINLAIATRAGEAAEAYGINADAVEDIAKHYMELGQAGEAGYEALADNAELASDAAIRYVRLNNALEDLQSDYDDYCDLIDDVVDGKADEIKANNKSLQSYQKLKKGLADIIGTNKKVIDSFGDDFIAKNADDIKKAIDGDIKAIQRLQKAAGDEIQVQLGLEDSPFFDEMQNAISAAEDGADLLSITGEAGLDLENYLQSLVWAMQQAGMTQGDIEAKLAAMGIDVDLEPMTESLNEAIANAEQAGTLVSDAFAANAGVDTEVTNSTSTATDEKEVTGVDITPHRVSLPYSLPTYTANEEGGYDRGTPLSGSGFVYGYSSEPHTEEETETKTTTATALKVKGATKSSGGTVSSNNVNGGSTGGKKGGGGGGGKTATHKAQTKKTSNENRYHNVEAQIDDLSRVYSKASSAKDRLFGKNRIDAIKQEEAALSKLITKQQAYLKEIGKYKTKDLNNLLSGVKADEQRGIGAYYTTKDAEGNEYGHYADIKSIKELTGLDLSLNEEGTLLNYEQLSDELVNWYNQQVDKFTNASAEEQEKLTNEGFLALAEAQYSAAQDLLDQYEETINEWQDKLEEIQELFREQQDKRFEEWSYKLELKIKITDEDKRYLEYVRKSMERFAKSAFAPVTELFTIWNDVGSDSDWKVLQHSAGDLKDAFNSLKEATHGDPIIDSATGAILQDFDYSQADWMDALDDVQDKIYAQIDALLELDETMSNYYSETLAKGEEKLDQYMTKMEDCTNVLKHFQTVSELLGKETDYKWMGEILTSQRDSIQNELEAASKEYEYAKAQYDTMLARYERDKNSVDEGTRELMEQELQAQYESMTKWQEAMLTKTEEFAEACIAVYENMVHQQGKVLENALTSGQGWDSMLASMDRVSAYQELILTRTNQLYETNKLMRKLSQDIDRTDSVAAKTKLANFRREIEDMQNMNEMSKFDLDVANARYEILKAQIALEEAQNAKSIVRLQRDSEGNYGYVYTADQDKIDNAQQALEDKQNDLYNLTLNKANENARALAELDKEMYDELERIAIEYRGDEEKIWEESLRVREEYAQRRAILERDYTEADYWQHQVSATKTNEAWANSYKKQLVNTDEWQALTSKFIGQVQSAHNELTANMDTYVAPVVGDNLYELRQKTDELRQSSEKYQKWFDNFAETNAERLDAIAEQTNKYWLQRDAVDALVESLRKMADEINNIRAAESGMSRSIDGYSDFDKNTDYSALMQEYLEAGGSQSDAEYKRLRAAREAKIQWLQTDEGGNKDASYWGSQGDQFDNVLGYYVANHLSGYITPAVQEHAAANGVELADILAGNTEVQKQFAEQMKESTGILKETADAIMEKAKLTTDDATTKITTATDKLIESQTKTLEESIAKYEEQETKTNELRQQQLTEANTQMKSNLDATSNSLNSHLDNLSGVMRSAADAIVTAMSNLHVDVSVSVSGAMPTFDTGGYTGSWGSSGKLAMLHEKELVLNAEDTLNMLTAIDMVRQLNNAIDLRAASSGFATSLSSPGYQGIDQTLEQTVTITAEFPNATNHSEIEEAFDTLINRATQYASRPRNTSYGINSANV